MKKLKPGHLHRKPISVNSLLQALRSGKSHASSTVSLKAIPLTLAEIDAKYGPLEPVRRVRVEPSE